eukprot:1178303-Prorocentrum_minimum.AAC.1
MADFVPSNILTRVDNVSFACEEIDIWKTNAVFVAEWLNKGLMAVLSSTWCCVAGGAAAEHALRGGADVEPRRHLPRVGLHTDIKPLLSRSTTGKFNSPPNY